MRLTDRLLTETPRPALSDPPFTKFADMIPDPVVIDGTDAHQLFMEMTAFVDDEISMLNMEDPDARMLHDTFGEGPGWQIAQFLTFDWRVLGTVAPPFKDFVVEFDVRTSMEAAGKAHGLNLTPRELVEIGQTACAFATFTHDEWVERISEPLSDRGEPGPYVNHISGMDLAGIEKLPFRWMLMVTTFINQPGLGLQGPMSTWVIPVDHEGHLFIDPGDHTLIHAVAFGPRSPGDRLRSKQYVMTQGFSVLIPALLTISLMHTPAKTKTKDGYHVLEERVPVEGRMARKYLERNFRPLTRWKVLDISPLREAIREAHGGRMPTDIAGLKRALHVVRGHTRTYMPNTYFGQKHDNPITVFTPAHKRGNAKHGVVQKEYHVSTGEAS